MISRRRIAQSILEYSMLIAVVASAFTAMAIYAKRAVQANLNMIEEQINVQPKSE